MQIMAQVTYSPAVDGRCEKKKQIQRGDMFEEYKHSLVGVKEQLN